MFHVNTENYHIAFSFDYTRGVNFEIKPNRTVTDITQCRMVVNDQTFINTLACCVKGDIFCKETGRKHALARALKDANLPKSVRAAVWDKYFHRSVK